MPFLSFRVQSGGIDKIEKTSFPRNYYLSNIGVFDSDLKDRVTCKAFTAKYESTFWAHGFVNTMAVYQKVFSENYKDLIVDYSYILKDSDGAEQTLNLQAPFTFTNLEFDPQWEAADELDRGKIHSIDMSFEVDAFLFEGRGVVPVNEVIVELFYNNGVIEGTPDKVIHQTGQTGNY